MATPHIFQALLAKHPGDYRIVNKSRDVVLATRIEAAFDSFSRRRGLLGRASLSSGTVLAIAPSNAIHTFGMQFAIDVLFITRDGRVVKRLLALSPRRLAFAARAFAVLEFAGRDAGVEATDIGDQLLIERSS